MPEKRYHSSINISKKRYPAKSPIRWSYMQSPARPRKRRNRHCKECGYYTREQCRNGGYVAARNWLRRVEPLHMKIIAKKGKWTRARTARFFGYSERQVSRLWNGHQRTYRDWIPPCCGSYAYYASNGRPHGARSWVAKKLYWVRTTRKLTLATLSDKRMIETRRRQLRSIRP